LAIVLVVGFIGMSSPSSIFAQYYDDDYESEYSQYYDNDDYEKSYDKYMKDDYSKPSIQNLKIYCDNSNRNPSDSNVDGSNAFGLPNGDSQSGQDRMNSNKDSNQKGNFKVICQNNNIKNIVNINNNDFNINNGTTINNNTVAIENNNANEQQFNSQISACNSAASASSQSSFDVVNSTLNDTVGFNFSANDSVAAGASAGMGSALGAAAARADCTNVTTTVGPIIANQSIADNDSGVITPNSIANDGQSIAATQTSNAFQNDNGIAATQISNSFQYDNGIEIQQQRTDDSHDLTAMEKVTKLKTQWLNQLP